jgi:uncharacterized protein YutD
MVHIFQIKETRYSYYPCNLFFKVGRAKAYQEGKISSLFKYLHDYKILGSRYFCIFVCKEYMGGVGKFFFKKKNRP